MNNETLMCRICNSNKYVVTGYEAKNPGTYEEQHRCMKCLGYWTEPSEKGIPKAKPGIEVKRINKE